MKKQQKIKKNKIAKLKIDQTNWNTTDEDEITRRKARAEAEKYHLVNQEPSHSYFSTYQVFSNGANKKYNVEIRSLSSLINSCDCPDYRTNMLGTCKHIEAILKALRKKGIKKFNQAAVKGNDRIEIFLAPNNRLTIRVLYPAEIASSLKTIIETFFSSDGSLLGDAVVMFDELKTQLLKNNKLSNKVRISQHIQYYVDYQKINTQKQDAKNYFLQDVEHGKRSLNFVKSPLLPYQQEGMLHLAFLERALLADEMGLGKTVQAIAACDLLRQLRGVQRVLVITPASLKAEWEEQISKFTDLSSLVIFGSRSKRLQQYKQNRFFYLMNYEQVISDHGEIQRLLAPDVIILDEAQRIKNWRTKTANAVKELKSRYAFVLTGTPVENRIDDIYSIIQFLDPHVFGPLFRFNRDFYQLDEEGKPIGYKNLDELYRRLRSIMLCRKKIDVEDELPKRLTKNYFINMESEQRIRYDEYQSRVVRLTQQAKKRPLRKEEFELLQKWLACMRMVCDSPYILDKTCRISPKLIELENILKELLEDTTSKVIIFSEWERMLFLVKEMAEENNWELAWHTGSVPQQKRREEINRFKHNKNCRLFLSTDAGSVGLNLQVANVVINLDLPWNPAKLEQRIARAWRKYQTRSVQVINLICENSIEHRMLYLLEQKQLMAQGVLGSAELKSMQMPSGRAAFMDRMEVLMGEAMEKNQRFFQNIVDKSQNKFGINSDDLKNCIIAEFGDELSLLQIYQTDAHQQSTVLLVVNEQAEKAEERLSSSGINNQTLTIETIDQKTLEVIQRLAKSGVLSLHTPIDVLHDQHTQDPQDIKKQRRQKQLDQVAHCLNQAERKHRMSKVLIEGDFVDEAVLPLREAFTHTVKAFLHITDDHADEDCSLLTIQMLTNKHNGPKAMPLLFKELMVANGERIDVKKLYHTHGDALNHIAGMKSKLTIE